MATKRRTRISPSSQHHYQPASASYALARKLPGEREQRFRRFRAFSTASNPSHPLIECLSSASSSACARGKSPRRAEKEKQEKKRKKTAALSSPVPRGLLLPSSSSSRKLLVARSTRHERSCATFSTYRPSSTLPPSSSRFIKLHPHSSTLPFATVRL
jgi:Sec7-like guanine-nucleotide exchange factor